MTDYITLSDRDLAMVIVAAEADVEAINKSLRQAKDELFNRKRNAIAAAYAAKGSQFGVIYLDEPDYQADITTSQKVEWDQEALVTIDREIREEWKADPSEYIDRKLSVKESKYKAWPSDLRAKFEPARTVKASAPTISITIKGEE